MYKLIEEARITVYDFHARILAKICAELVKNKDLTYLLANLQSLTTKDIEKIFNFLYVYKDYSDYGKQIEFIIKEYEDIVVFQKCIQLGITRGMLGLFSNEEEKTLFKNKICHLTEFANEFYKLLDEIKSSII